MKNRNLIFAAILSALVCFTLLPQVQAVVPAPDGDYPNFNTAEGQKALFSLTTGQWNTALGAFTLWKNTDGSFNTAVGTAALLLNTGGDNTAVGAAALLLNTGSDNTAVGTAALENNTVDANTATGAFALFANTTGGTTETSVLGFDLGPNTAVGFGALENNVDSSSNTAVGYNALNSQVTGLSTDPHLAANTAVGFEALANVTGSATGNNVANTALGYQALVDLTDGFSNIAIGFQAGAPLGVGGTSLTSGNANIFIGTFQGPASDGENFHTYIGNINSNLQDFSAGVIDYVTVDQSTGLLGHTAVVSSRRYKEDIKPLDKTSEALFALKPVSFRLKKEYNPKQPLGFGLIAEEVGKVNPDLVYRNNKGQVESVRYEMVNAMLLNEFLKEHKRVEAQQATIAELKSTVAQQQKGMEVLTAQLKEQAAQIQKVSAQLEMSKQAAKVVVNKP